jgi:hypothetical protein
MHIYFWPYGSQIDGKFLQRSGYLEELMIGNYLVTVITSQYRIHPFFVSKFQKVVQQQSKNNTTNTQLYNLTPQEIKII